MKIKLPEPTHKGQLSIEEALLKRRSIREYRRERLTLQEIGQTLWSGYGVTSEEGFRTAPSAGALFPLRLYCYADDVKDLAQGIYQYDPQTHSIEMLQEGDFSEKLMAGTFFQDYVAEAPAVLIISADYSGPEEKYGDQGKKFTWMDLGHLGQNIHLQAVSLNLGTVAVAAVRPGEVEKILSKPNEEVLYLMPLGKPGC